MPLSDSISVTYALVQQLLASSPMKRRFCTFLMLAFLPVWTEYSHAEDRIQPSLSISPNIFSSGEAVLFLACINNSNPNSKAVIRDGDTFQISMGANGGTVLSSGPVMVDSASLEPTDFILASGAVQNLILLKYVGSPKKFAPGESVCIEISFQTTHGVGSFEIAFDPPSRSGRYNQRQRSFHLGYIVDFPIGASGVQGLAGPQGPTGLQGPQGAAGAQGPIGPQGPTGPQGIPGATGSQGPMGSQGPAGVTGASGPIGPAGPVGPQGIPGATGPQGPMGPSAIIIGGGTGSTNLSGSANRFVAAFHSNVNAAENAVSQLMVISGELSYLSVRLDNSPNGTNSYTFTIRKNGLDSNLSCTILGSATSCSDDDPSHSVTFDEGDLISVKAVPSSPSPAARTMRWTAKFAPS